MALKLEALMNLILFLLFEALNIYLYLIIASVIMSWLVMFDVLNIRNKFVRKCYELLNAVVNPGMAKLRKFIPPIGNIDFTPMAMMFGIYLVQGLLIHLMR
jgi:YggT family protein